DFGCRHYYNGQDLGCIQTIYVDENKLSQCQDGIDNECDFGKCDLYVDFGDDPDCLSLQDNTENKFNWGRTQCSDGINNDGDFYYWYGGGDLDNFEAIDCADFSCLDINGICMPWKNDEEF